MAKNKVHITESKLKDIISQTLSESFRNPADNYVVDKNELKQKCAELAQKCAEFQSVLSAFGVYLDGAEEEIEGEESQLGIKTKAYLRSTWTQKLSDEYFSQDLYELSKQVQKVSFEINELVSMSEDI